MYFVVFPTGDAQSYKTKEELEHDMNEWLDMGAEGSTYDIYEGTKVGTVMFTEPNVIIDL